GAPQADPFGAPQGGGDPFGGQADPFGAPQADPFGAPPPPPGFGAPGAFGDPFGAPAQQPGGFDPFGAPAPQNQFDPFGGGQPPLGDDFSESPTMARVPARGPQPDPFGAPAQDVSLPISNERNAFLGSDDSSPFDAPEPELDVVERTMEVPAPTGTIGLPPPPGAMMPPPGANVRKTRMMPGKGGGGGAFGLTLMGLQGKKRDRAAEVLARLRGCSKEEALGELTGNVVSVLQGVSKSEAESWLALFTKAEIPAKITGKG